MLKKLIFCKFLDQHDWKDEFSLGKLKDVNEEFMASDCKRCGKVAIRRVHTDE